MNAKNLLAPGCLSALLVIAACGGAAQQVQLGRNALQTGRPEAAVPFLRQAAELDPNHRVSSTLRDSVLTYLGRAYYETGNLAEARPTLEKAIASDKDNHAARLYLGLTLLRSGDRERGRKEAEIGLKGIYESLERIAADRVYGDFWDPGRDIRSGIQRILGGKLEVNEFVASAQRIGGLLDEEIDKASRDEARTRYRGGGE
jgi:tetratricopeptide (TPR) repeat protein